MKPIRPFFRYRRDLTDRARQLRRDPTAPERKLWYDFLATHPAKFTRQKPIGVYIADFYCAERRLVIELDGDTHFDAVAAESDRRRAKALAIRGIRVIRFTNAEVMEQFEAVCARIEEAIEPPARKSRSRPPLQGVMRIRP